MKAGWNVTKLVSAGALGVLLLVLSLGGAAIAGVTGIPGSSGIINVFVSGAMFALCCLVIRRFGAATIMGFVYSVLAIPLPLFGTPGFVPKILLGISSGLLADVIFLILRRNERIASLAVGAATQLLISLGIVVTGRLFGMPGIEQFEKIAFSPVGIIAAIVIGGIAGFLGWLIYSRIRDTAVVVRIQGQDQPYA